MFMDAFEIVQDFFCSMHCSSCNKLFKPDAIKLLKQEYNFLVVKITCTECDQPVGLAIVGVQPRYDIKQDTWGKEIPASYTHPTSEEPVKIKEPLPITYDDVVEAHKFFSTLGPDWMKYIKDRDIKDQIENSLENDV